MADFKVIIVGGGLSGSLLANGLLCNKVSFMVYERDTEDTKRDGYHIRLGDGAMKGFAACLTAAHSDKIMQKLGKSFGVAQTAPSLYNTRFQNVLDLSRIPSYSKSAAINRVVLRNMLLEPIKEANLVKFSKQFTRYEIVTEEGSEKVKVHFEDGTSDSGDVLIAADGGRSKINIQAGLNNLVKMDRHWTFMSKGSLPYERMMRLPEQLRKGPILTFAGNTTFYYALYLPPKDANMKVTSYDDTVSYDEAEASFFWALHIPIEDVAGGTVDQSAGRKQLCLDHVKTWAPEYRQMISIESEDADASDIYATQICASERPSKDWRRQFQKSSDTTKANPRVWFAGDAMHAMQANRGQGGNQAMADCADMLPQLLKLKAIADSGKPVTTADIAIACKVYEDTMMPRAFGWVAKSGGSKSLNINLDGWLGTLIKGIGRIVVPILQLYYRVFAHQGVES